MAQNMEANGNYCIPPTVNDLIYYNYYSMLKPTLFVLRFFGGPTGLWRFQLPNFKPGAHRKLCTLLMLLVMNVTIGFNLQYSITVSTRTDFTLSQNMNQFFVVAISTSGVLCLDILWLRRQKLRQLLKSIDWEPKCCPVIDQEVKRKNERELRTKTIKLVIFQFFFIGYISYVYGTITMNSRMEMEHISKFEAHMNIALYVLGYITIYPLPVITSFYISLSWVFRLKIYRISRFIRKMQEHAIQEEKKEMPTSGEAKAIEVWFSAFIIQFKTYNLVFKQVAGLVYVVMVWSVLSLAEETVNSFMTKSFADMEISDFVHEFISAMFLVYFLYSISSVEHGLKKMVKLLYSNSLAIKFERPDRIGQSLSEKFQLLGETIYKSELNLSIFGLIHINRGLIVTTFSLLLTYSFLMYELFGDNSHIGSKCVDNHRHNTTSVVIKPLDLSIVQLQ